MKFETSWVRAPHQERSRLTVERLLGAVHSLLEKDQLTEATVGQIVMEASCSTGSFYARFANKQALLECFHERLCQRAYAFTESFLEPERWSRASLRTILDAYLRVLVKNCRKNRGVLRAASLWANIPLSAEMKERSARLSQSTANLLIPFFERHSSEFVHPYPRRAATVVSELAAGFLWKTLLSVDSREEWDESVVTEELLCIVHGYLASS